MFVHTVIMVIEPHMKQGRQHKLISTIFLATSVTKKLDHNKGNLSDIKGLLLTGGAVTVCLLIILDLLCAGAFYRVDRLFLFQP